MPEPVGRPAASPASAGSDPATVRFRVHAEGTSRANFRSRIAGRTISVDHLPETTGPLEWGEVLFELSRHPAATNRPEGVLEVLYRLRTDVDRATTSTEGTRAIVDLPVAAGRWQNVTFDLLGDLHRVWPDLDLGGSDLARASTLTVDAGGECFHRLQVVDRRGQVIAFGQPTWTLSKPPPTGIPARRQA